MTIFVININALKKLILKKNYLKTYIFVSYVIGPKKKCNSKFLSNIQKSRFINRYTKYFFCNNKSIKTGIK